MAKAKDDSTQSGLQLVLQRNAFYRDNYRKALFALLFAFLLNVFLGYSVVYRYLHPPQPQYFPTTPQYQLIKVHPLSDPIFDNNYVLQWAADAVQKAFSLDFIHWRHQLQNASGDFTPAGWHWFLDAMKKSGNLKTLVNLQMVANAVVTGAPVVQYQGVVGGKYLWEIELPILVTYTNVNRTINQPLKITLIVTRVPVQSSKERIGISNFLPVVQQQNVSG